MSFAPKVAVDGDRIDADVIETLDDLLDQRDASMLSPGAPDRYGAESLALAQVTVTDRPE